VGTLFNDDGFRVAVVVALLGAGLAWWLSVRTTFQLPAPAVVVVATLAGYRADHHLTFSLVLGVALLAMVAGVSHAGAGWITAAVAALAGAGILVGALPDALPGWISFVVFVSIVPIAPVVELRARKWRRLAPVALLAAIAGVYACVPDTELVRPLLGAAIVVAFLALLPDGTVTSYGAGAVAGLAVWASGIEGVGRPGAVVGAIACVAALVLWPAWPDRWQVLPSWWVTITGTAILIVWCSRIAGVRESGWAAAFLAALGFVVTVAVVVATRSRERWRR
jgi:hypothetical protein